MDDEIFSYKIKGKNKNTNKTQQKDKRVCLKGEFFSKKFKRE
jgi:hypothetical protein